MVNEHPRSARTGPRASDHSMVSTARSLDSAAPPVLNQLASVFPARLKLLGTNGHAVLTTVVKNDCTAKEMSTLLIC